MLMTSFREVPKSPTREQQIQPEFISLISIPDSFKNPPSIPISPNSFSIRTVLLPSNASFNNFLIRVVLPAPRKPDTTSIFVIVFSSNLGLKPIFFIFYHISRIVKSCPLALNDTVRNHSHFSFFIRSAQDP